MDAMGDNNFLVLNEIQFKSDAHLVTYIDVPPFSQYQFSSPEFFRYFAVPELIIVLELFPDRPDECSRTATNCTNHFESDSTPAEPNPTHK